MDTEMHIRSPFDLFLRQSLGQPEAIADIVASVVSEEFCWITNSIFEASDGCI